ncbi:hypothetical protein PQR02_22455 [Paraburkholderia sediminicola]|uniref:Uncharacterized protein n=2 Tax=Burkholderiaceae TaxID=119060 RepID=A0ACC7NCU9_9BURK
MKGLSRILRRAVIPGSAAASTSALVAAVRATGDGSTPYAPFNAVTHWIWPRRAFAETGPSVRFTLSGLAIHYAAAIFWGALFESLLIRRYRNQQASSDPVAVAGTAATVATVAYVVDYHGVPKRLTPGFEAHLSKRSIFYVYAGFAAGFAVAALWRRE